MPPLHALAAFEAAARHQSFSKAAQELYLTHSAVSHRIRLLEEHLETQLFLRLNKKVSLTPQGEAFLATVRETLTTLHKAASSLKGHTRRSLKVSVLPAFASNWLIQRLGDFYRRHPEIDLEIQTSGQLVNLRSGEVDLAIRYGAGDWPGLHTKRLFTDLVYPVASGEYLATLPAIREPIDLRNATLLRNRKLPWRRWFDAAGLDWSEPVSGPIYSDLGLMLEAAVSGQGVALARNVLVSAQIDSGKLIQLTDVTAPSEWNFFLVCLPEAAEREEVMAFFEWVLGEARPANGEPAERASAHTV